MIEAHHGKAHGRGLPGLLLELVMIGVGVFLGLMAEQWRESRQHHELAMEAIRNFRTELASNAAHVKAFVPYHDSLRVAVDRFVAEPGPHTFTRFQREASFHGIAPVTFEHTAWDLALATQSLAYLDPKLAYRVSVVYTTQAAFQTYENAFIQTAFAPSTFAHGDDATGLTQSLASYMGDVALNEPMLLKQYDALIPALDSALGR
ncbi:MAG TPA: hypothetical protein VG818_07385 [Gemmatimonadaceae bacterium]|jgi:hypothetical protein|nr:hypothetical protein [Gemmatimonadaceae bacterium]